MLIQDIITAFKTTALSHRNIESFDIGDSYLIDGNLAHEYPKFFMETPFQIQWNEKKQPYYTLSFAFYVLMNKLEDNTLDQLQGVSDSALITEQILAKMDSDFSNMFGIESCNSLTYNDMSNEGLSTTRTDITLIVLKNVCDDEDNLGEIFSK